MVDGLAVDSPLRDVLVEVFCRGCPRAFSRISLYRDVFEENAENEIKI